MQPRGVLIRPFGGTWVIEDVTAVNSFSRNTMLEMFDSREAAEAHVRLMGWQLWTVEQEAPAAALRFKSYRR